MKSFTCMAPLNAIMCCDEPSSTSLIHATQQTKNTQEKNKQGKGHMFTFRFGFFADGHRERGTSLSPSRFYENEAESSRFRDRNEDSSRKRKRDPESIEVSRGIAEPSRFESRTTESPKERRKEAESSRERKREDDSSFLR
ncbi:hypothetical protein YC2023_086537 [Brassica napus]